MELLNEIEKYLDNAEGITFRKNDDEIQLIVWFDDKKFLEFRSTEDYLKIIDFFKDRKVILLIKEKANEEQAESFYRTSFVDKVTADVVNLNSAFWGKDTLKEFREMVKEGAKIALYVTLIDKAQKQFIPHPAQNTHEPMILDGYLFEKATSEDENSSEISN